MNKQEYLEFHKQFCNKMIEITEKKNSDYTGTSLSPFSNFEKAELLGICSNEAGFLIRIMDKVSRVISYLNKGELLVKDESVTDSLLDAANYFILLAGYIASRTQQGSEHKKQVNTDLNEIDEVDKDVLKLLNVQEGYSYDAIFETLRPCYTITALLNSMCKLLKLELINEIKEDCYRTVK